LARGRREGGHHERSAGLQPSPSTAHRGLGGRARRSTTTARRKKGDGMAHKRFLFFSHFLYFIQKMITGREKKMKKFKFYFKC
jgi:hypothetical protein